MIISFADRATEDIFNGKNSKAARAFSNGVRKAAKRRLDALNAATSFLDLNTPGNSFEQLQKNLAGLCSIRANSQFRIVFKFENGNAYNVCLMDYHS